MLREVAEGRRCEAEAFLALSLEGERGDQLAGESGHEADVAGVFGPFAGRVDRVHVQPGLAADLEGACVDDVGGRGGLRPFAAFDQEARLAAIGEEECGDHADGACTHDQDGHFEGLGHGFPRGGPAVACAVGCGGGG